MTEKAGVAVASKSGKKCDHCGKPGHVEANCWKKHPEKIPEWAKGMQKKNGGETGSAAVREVLLCSINSPNYLPAFGNLDDELWECKETMRNLCYNMINHVIGGCPICREHVIRATDFHDARNEPWVEHGYMIFDHLVGYCTKCRSNITKFL